MANCKSVELRNKNTGEIKEAPVGFSWTTLFFGCFPALFRGDWKWLAIQFVVAMFTCGLSSFVFAFIYNKLYIKDLLDKGFVPNNEIDGNNLVTSGIITSSQLQFYVEASNKSSVSEPSQTVPTRLKEYKELLDAGAITEDEFNAKKAELLK